MRCRTVRRLLIMESGGEYALPRTGPFGRHLERCPLCREEAILVQREERLLRKAFTELPVRPDFTRRVLDAIRSSRGQTPMP